MAAVAEADGDGGGDGFERRWSKRSGGRFGELIDFLFCGCGVTIAFLTALYCIFDCLEPPLHVLKETGKVMNFLEIISD